MFWIPALTYLACAYIIERSKNKKEKMERFLIRPASVRTPEVNQTQSPSPSQVPKAKLTHPATIEKWKLDWLGVEEHDEKKTHIL